MSVSIVISKESIIVDKILISRIIRRIYVDKVNLAFVCLFKQLQRSEIVALDEKVHLTAVVDEKAAVLGEYRGMGSKHLVDLLPMLLKDKSVFLRSHVLFKIGEVGEQVRRVFVLRRGRNVGANRLYFCKQIFTLLLRYIRAHIINLFFGSFSFITLFCSLQVAPFHCNLL